MIPMGLFTLRFTKLLMDGLVNCKFEEAENLKVKSRRQKYLRLTVKVWVSISTKK